MIPSRFAVLSAVAVFATTVSSFAQSNKSAVWKDADERVLAQSVTAQTGNRPLRDIVPKVYRTLTVNKTALKNALGGAALDSTGPIETTGIEFEIPMPSGENARFLIQESPIMESKLAAKFPELKTYVAQGIDDPTATARIDVTPRGFHAIILSPKGDVYVDPYSRDNDTNYITYFKRDFVADKPFSCGTESKIQDHKTQSSAAPLRPTGATLRTYRLALACTGEYSVAVCSPSAATVSGAMSAIVTSINRCSAVYERDFAIRFKLIDNNEKIVYLDGTTDPYTNNNGSAMLSQNQSNLTTVIGSANYDFGHVFSTNGGGIAQLGVICVNGSKAQGVTGTNSPTGDPYDIDYVVHEMGHQFGGNHTFNATTDSCSGNRSSGAAYEVGSGTTIMAYAGICGIANTAPHSDDYFHTKSYQEMDAFSSGATGGSCPVSTATGNTAPTITPLGSFTIPMGTPFALTASATDPNGDTLTYCWEEFDLGSAQTTANPVDSGNMPLFRTFPPTTNPTRIFPSLTYILNNANVPPASNPEGFSTGEVLPSTTRSMKFLVTVRDNRVNGGGSNYGGGSNPDLSTTVASTSAAGPFAVTGTLNGAPTIAGGSTQTVTWSAANSNLAPVSCANVKISLSTDGGYTFPTVLAPSVPNSPGSASVTIPDVATTQGRIKVEGVGNIFFDISDANFTITSTNHAPAVDTVGGSITVIRGKPTPMVGNVGTASDSDLNPMTVAVSNLPFGAHIIPSLTVASPTTFNISFSATVDCPLVTTLTTRTYPVTVTVTDSNGATTSGTVNLIVAPNPSPTLGAYPNITVAVNSSGTSTPAATATDSNGNLIVNPYSVIPTTLPGGGTVSVNQSTGVVTATTTAGSTLGLTTVRVTALDSCGAAAVQLFTVTVVATANPLLSAGTASAPTAESCAPSNAAVDPGETVTVNLPINNTGSSATTNLVATLQNSGGVTPITLNQNYGAIAANGSATRAFQFTASGTCGNTITVTLQLQDGATNFGNITYTIRLGVLTPTTTLFENFEGVSPPALPGGWTVDLTGAASPWATNTTSPDSGSISVSAAPVGTVSDNRLVSVAVIAPSVAPQLSFRHRWNLEFQASSQTVGYDGGVLEIAINGGAFADISTNGGGFVSGGYTRTISTGFSSPIAGRPAWSGADAGYITTTVNLPPSAAGQSVKFRWRLCSDSDTIVANTIWRVDTINLIAGSYVCSNCSSPPAITNGPPPSPVVVGTPYNFTFTWTGSPAPTFSVTNGTLPPGLSLSTGGVLSGTPTSAGNGSFPNITVTATNGNAPNAQQTFSLGAVTQAGNYIASFGLTGGNAAYLFDYDLDSIANLMEYALGLSPTVASQVGLPVVIVKDYSGTKYLSMTFNRSSVATDLTYIVEGSSDLSNWIALAKSTGGGATTGFGLVVETGPAPTFTVEVKDTVAIDGTPGQKRFIRLNVTSP